MQTISQHTGTNFTLFHGDSCEVMKGIPDNSIDFTICSPPFQNLYIYSDSERDLGNSSSAEEFFTHYQFIIKENLRITVPGRICAIHVKDLPRYANVYGTTGLIDFPGACIQEFESAGWVFHSRTTIWKCPVTERERTNNNGLLHKTVKRDTSQVRMGMADYLICFRKPPEEGDGLMSAKPVVRPNGFLRYVGEQTDLSNQVHPSKFARKSYGSTDDSIAIWRRYAEPVWWDIDQTDVLNFKLATSDKDARHICLAKGSMVLTKERGYVPIQEIEIGENVLTHMGRWRPVLAKQKTSDNAKIVSVKAQGVHDLKVTPNHKVWSRMPNGKDGRKEKARKAIPEWAEANQLCGRYVNLKLPPVEYNDTSNNVWWIVGRWIADGHLAPRGTMHISVGEAKLPEFRRIVKERCGFEQNLTATQILIRDPDREIRDIISRCGHLAHNKKLPVEAFTLDEEKAKSLLDGYLSGDGHYDTNRDRWTISTASKELAMGLQLLIQRAYGSVSTIHRGRGERKCVIEGRTVNAKPEWVVTFNVSGYTYGFIEDDGAWKPVKEVLDAGSSETWNIRVEEDESYTAEGCIVKNCPLQIGLIERAIEIWSNPGDVVFSPFAGIGSEGVVSIKCGRKFVGIELKENYVDWACRFLREQEKKQQEVTLFDSETSPDLTPTVS